MSCKIRISYFKHFNFLFIIFLCTFGLFNTTANSQIKSEKIIEANEQFKKALNKNTVTILGGSLSGTYLRIIDDISRTLENNNDIRILPIRGGTVSNVRDILYLRGIDMGIMRADVIETFKGKKHFEDIEKRLNYITVLHHEEFHILSSDPSIKSVLDLNGKIVAMHNETHLSGKLVLEKLNIKPKRIIKTNIFSAAQKTKTGKYHAIIRVTGKPFSGTSRLKKIDPNLRLIPLTFSEKLIDTVYFPTLIKHSDYPNFIEKDKEIPTIAVHAILGVFNWKKGTERYRRLSNFTKLFFSNFKLILNRNGRHPKWNQVNLAAKLAGWNRFQPAKDWLSKSRAIKKSVAKKKTGQTENKKKLLAKFQKFLDRKLSESESDALFDNFKKWRENQ